MSLSAQKAEPAAVVPPEQVAALRRAAIDYVARATACTLDGSEESLAYVDHYIDQVKKGSPPQPEALKLVAGAIGVYFGELCVARFGGRWQSGETPLDWRLELEAAPLIIDPIGMAGTALLANPDAEAGEDNLGFSLLPADKDLYAPLEEALSRLAPVSAEYYYSLTGRFETLGYLVDLTVELKQQKLSAGDGRSESAAAALPELQ